MTKAELARALRERMKRIRTSYPEVCAFIDSIPDERFIAGHLNCAACRKRHISLEEALVQMEKSKDLIEWLEWSQEQALARYPKKCIERIGQIESKLKRPD